MNHLNFDKEMQKIISGLNGEKPKLLLHACCAPCSTACLEKVKDFFDVTVYFYNPNMDSEKEYKKRADEEKRLCEIYGIKVIVEDYIPDEFYSIAKGLEKEKEGGKRCERCFYLRLSKTARKAKENGYDFFSTTLTLSPLKNADLINRLGREIERENGVKFLLSDFKKRNGYLESIDLSKKYGLYRQSYCGCVFSVKM